MGCRCRSNRNFRGRWCVPGCDCGDCRTERTNFVEDIQSEDNPKEILKARLAKGEISKEEYEDLLSVVQ